MRLPEVIGAALRDGGAVVASSPRAARALRQLHGELQRERGLNAWQAADILDWDAWLEHLWQQRLRSGSESRLLLSKVQEHEVWARLVRPSIEGRRLISIDGVADLSQGAYALLCAYCSLDFLRSEMLGPDADSFCAWAREFEREGNNQGWLSRSKLTLILRDALLQEEAGAGQIQRAIGSLPVFPPRITLIGFDRETPAQRRLLAAVEAHGCTVQRPASAMAPASQHPIVKAADERNEIAVCAQWVRRELELAAILNKKIQVAVIVPNLQTMRGGIERIFRQELAPHSIAVDAPEAPLPFEFSLGVAFDSKPMVRAALLLLRWFHQALRQEELTWLLLSGFFWREESDLLPIAEFDAGLREATVLPPEYSLDDFLRRHGWNRNEILSGLRQRLRSARQLWRAARKQSLSFAEWVELVRQILSAADWPGAHRLISEDFQVLTKWMQLLDSLEMLAFDGRRVSYQEFLRVLERQAASTIFSPQSRGAAVEILGPFEAAGMEFDAAWFLGADDANWPAPARPHPFLPKAFQKQRGMPHADDADDWELAKLATERIRRSVAKCIFSYAAQDKDGQRRPSTLLDAECETISAAQMREHLLTRDENEREPAALFIEEDQASGIHWPAEQTAGGYSVLKMQAACPFQAFASVRLHAIELNRRDWGLDPSERGNLLHRVLEKLWGELKSRDALLEARRSGSLRAIVERHVDAGLARYEQDAMEKDHEGETQNETYREMYRWSSAYLQAERKRVVHVIEEWLDYEGKRVPFTVEHNEEPLSATVGELKLKLRADRIDRIENGRLLIDYKTGKATSTAWDGERPDEPQLPLYAAFGNIESLQGVLLAQIRAEGFKFEGCVEDTIRSGLPGKPQSFSSYSQDLRRQWETTLLTLGEEFLKGEAQVDPKRRSSTCEFCPLPGLCRVAETGRESTEEEGGESDEA